jgi:hypothetical protein
MSDEGKQDHWAELASLLGAEPRPTEQPVEKQPPSVPPAAEAELAEPPRTPRTFAAPAAKRTASDWGRLAEVLGIEVPVDEPPPPPAARRVERTEPVEEPMAEEPMVEEPMAEELPDSAPAVVFASVDTEPEAFEVREVLPEEEGEPTDLSSLVETEEGAPEATTAPGDRERPGRRRRKRRRRGRRPDDSAAARPTETGDVELELPETTEQTPEEAEELPAPQESEEFAVSEESEGQSASQEEESEERGSERPRRRRRRRRRRGPSREGETAGSVEGLQEPAADAGEESVEAEDLAGPEELVEQDDLLEQEEAGPVAEEESAGDLSDLDDDVEKASHHGIPTWDEAVGIVIAANLEARARNPAGSPRGRGGRGRGGRG